MERIGRYRVLSTLHEDDRTRIVRAVDDLERAVIVKVAAAVPPSSSARARLRREHDICRDLATATRVDAAATVPTLGRIPVPVAANERDTPAHIAFLDEGGTSLTTILRRGPMSPAQALRIGARLATILDRVHAAGIIHKDIKPSNLLVSDDGTVTLLDFGIACRLESESQQDGSTRRLDGSLPYVSPEQTGRVNRPVDTRSDLYSLGATLYECVTGRVPFPEQDPAEVIYGHIAREPALPSVVRSGVPAAADAIITRLLAKSADKRYQSALGAAHDLAAAASALEAGRSLDGFVLGASDRSVRFVLPTRLYGRDSELQTLDDALQRASRGSSEFALVHGWSGVGKTALVAELGRHVAMGHGLFVQGKFDQFRRHSPFHSVIQCLSGLFGRILAESSAVIEAWRERLTRTFGPSVGVIAEIVPESAAILGHTALPEALDPEAARLRLGRIVTELLGLFATPGRPLVMFLDDLQWADLGSLELLRGIATGGGIPHLLLVGSYRSNEVDASHPLALELGRIRSARTSAVTDIELAGLSRFRLTEYVADALGRLPDETEPLAMLVHDKTGGNPFFVQELLRHLHKSGALRPHAAGGFTYDLPAIRKASPSGNVVELLVRKIESFGDRAARSLSVAAALGTTFTFGELEGMVDLDVASLAEDLWFALAEGLIAPLDGDYDVAGLVDDGSISPAYSFRHDRVQQAAYELIPHDRRASLHLRIAAQLAHTPDRQFDRADHLLAGEAALDGADPLITAAARFAAAEVLAEAGARARHAAAYGPGITYLNGARRLLGADGYTRHATTMLAATNDLATCEYLCGNSTAADALFVEAYAAARTDVERANSFVLRVALRIGKSQVVEALELAREGLQCCGETIDLTPDQAAVGAAFGELHAALAGRSLSVLADIPEATDPLKVAALEILNDTAAPAYYVNENLYALIILKMCTLSAKYGQTPVSSFGWALYGVVLGPILGDFASSSQAAVLARQVQARFGRASMEAKVALCLCGFVDHWTQPPLASLPGLEAGVRAGLMAGDPVFATFCSISIGYTWLLTGLDAGQLAEGSARELEVCRTIGMAEAPEVHAVNLRLAHALSSAPGTPIALGDDEAEWLATLDGFALRVPIHMALLAKLELSLVFDTHDGCDALVARSAELLPRSFGTGHHSMHAWLSALIASRQLEDAPDRADALATLEAATAQIAAWAVANPGSFGHKRLGLEALAHARQGRIIEAMDTFDAAITSAADAAFVKNAALLADAAARWLRRLGRTRLADAYVREAAVRYREWGATRRVFELEATHRWLRPLSSSGGRGSNDASLPRSRSPSTGPSTSTTSDVRAIDDWSLVKASQALAGEMRFERLVERLMESLAESSGAQRVVLFVPGRDGTELDVAAERRVDVGPVAPVGTLATRDDVPRGVIRYVSRARTPVLIGDLGEPSDFATDPFVSGRRVEAILCVPAVHGGRLEAVLYLDHGVLAGAFTPDRAQIVSVLASQLAISLANTRLFEHVDRQARAFERFVPAEFLTYLHRSRNTGADADMAARANFSDVGLGDAVRCNMAVMFVDLRAYTRFSEAMSPEDDFAFINQYLSRISPLVREHGGFIDKYMGDGILALFDSADEAVGAVEGIFARVDELNGERIARGDEQIRVGVGLHYGSLMLGIVGEVQRLNVTVISDVVNTTSRLERTCKYFKVRAVASDALLAACERGTTIPRRRLGNVGVEGRKGRIDVFELLGTEPERVRVARERSRLRFEAAVTALEDGQAAIACEILAALVEEYPEDDAAHSLLAFARQGGGPLNAPKE